MKKALETWLNEYSENKNLMDKLNTALNSISNDNSDKATLILTRRDIDVIAAGLDKTIESNKESIIDCSYNIIMANKK